MEKLAELYLRHDGKVSDKWSSYLSTYDVLLGPFRDRPVRILEIGVQNGGSLEIWSRFFPNAELILGCDIDPCCGMLTYRDPRISVVIGDANEPSTCARITALSETFDIVIDDGSHRSSDIVKSFACYFPKVTEGGLFVAEDLHCSYWETFEGGIEAPYSAINFFKRLADYVNREHWGATAATEAMLSWFADYWQTEFDPCALSLIDEVRFRNSLAVVSKGRSGGNMLGPRTIAGKFAVVAPMIADLDKAHHAVPNQTLNGFGPLTPRLEEAVAGRVAAAAAVERAAAAEAALIAERHQLKQLQGELQRHEQMEAAQARLHDERVAEQAQIRDQQVENQTLRDELGRLAVTMSQSRDQALEMQSDNEALRGELARARSNAVRIWKDNLIYSVLKSLSSSDMPIGKKARIRFARSAKKRDPKRSLGPALAAQGQPAHAAPAFGSTTRSNAVVMPGRIAQDADRKNVLVVLHEASHTGAPILAHNIARVLSERYNVTMLTLGGGDLVDALLDVSVDVVMASRHLQHNTPRILKRHLSDKSLAFAVVNSIESRSVLPLLDEMGVTSVSLIHEFASYTRPLTAFAEVMNHSDEVVFSSPLTLTNAAETTGLELAPKVHVFPQGKCVVPGKASVRTADTAERQRLKAHLRPVGQEGDFLVIGAGFVQMRKGVDLFIEVARHTLARANGRKLRFAWIGGGYDPENDMAYSAYLHDQLNRSGLIDIVRVLPPTTEIEYAYELADLLLLPSRLDPLPNVAIDAMLHGLPVLCFDTATGISEILRENGLEAACVAEYLDTGDMAEKLRALVNSPELYADVADRTQTFAREIFDMGAYVNRIEALALAVNARKRNRMSDIDLIASDARFSPAYVMNSGAATQSAREVAQLYLSSLSKLAETRRPEPGFNPHVYTAHLQIRSGEPLKADPYSHFLAAGRPEGLWSLPVIRETADVVPTEAALTLRTALHIHAHYVDPLEGLLSHLAANQARPTIYVSVHHKEAEAEVDRIMSRYAGDHSIRIMPNAGRDIGPFLTGFGAELVDEYDIVGHVHTKKSVALSNDDLVQNWTHFLQENVLGGETGGAMLDRVLNAFAEDEKLGVVFPADPNLLSWTRNRDRATQLARRMGLGDLPHAFDFPVGTMFWMRSEALRPFVDLRLGWSDYPREPVAYDGTMLHALERLFGIAPVLQGYRSAVTCVTGLTR